MNLDWLTRLGHRLRIRWMLLAMLLAASLFPIWLYHQRVLTLSESQLELNEQLQQAEVTRSLAEEVHLFERGIRQQLIGSRKIFELARLIHRVDNPALASQVTALLETMVQNNPEEILYVTAIGRSSRGQSSGSFDANTDPFAKKAMERAFQSAIQGAEFHSDPLAIGPESKPAFVLAVPLSSGQQFHGMLAALISLDSVLDRLRETSTRGQRDVYIVDRTGRIVAHPDTRAFLPGTDVSTSVRVVAEYKASPKDVRTTETRPFEIQENGEALEMIGTFTPVPDMNWAVIAHRRLSVMRAVAGINELQSQAQTVMLIVLLGALVIGWVSAVGITQPISALADSTLAISRGEFGKRAPVQGAAEISQLASTFNLMAGNIETYIEQLKQAAEENRELFIGSIRMLAAAIDEKDPYTRGHSGRVAKYSIIIAEELGLEGAEIEKLRVSALLHDVGKIGVDDRVLKKPGSLTEEEFALMKQHPAKGANIMRPVAQLKEMLPGIELHHEHMDGKGYPYGLTRDQIPMMARIIAVADTLDAMTTNRPYQSAKDIQFALDRIRQLSGTKFDPEVVRAFEAAIEHGRLRLSATLVEV
ncbi:MAG: HD domain-containing phosphohydrolase [Candidatus Acidiferrales bacterium]